MSPKRPWFIWAIATTMLGLGFLVHHWATITQAAQDLLTINLGHQLVSLKELKLEFETAIDLGRGIGESSALAYRLKQAVATNPSLNLLVMRNADMQEIACSGQDYPDLQGILPEYPFGEFPSQANAERTVPWRFFQYDGRGELALALYNDKGKLFGTLRANFALELMDTVMAPLTAASLQITLVLGFSTIIIFTIIFLVASVNFGRIRQHRLIPRIVLYSAVLLVTGFFAQSYLVHNFLDEQLDKNHLSYASVIANHIQNDFQRLDHLGVQINDMAEIESYLTRKLILFPELKGIAIINQHNVVVHVAGAVTMTKGPEGMQAVLNSQGANTLTHLNVGKTEPYYLYLSGIADHTALLNLFGAIFWLAFSLILVILIILYEVMLFSSTFPLSKTEECAPGVIRFNLFVLFFLQVLPLSILPQLSIAVLNDFPQVMAPLVKALIFTIPQVSYFISVSTGLLIGKGLSKVKTIRSRSIIGYLLMTVAYALFIFPSAIWNLTLFCIVAGISAGILIPLALNLEKTNVSKIAKIRFNYTRFVAFASGSIVALIAGGLMAQYISLRFSLLLCGGISLGMIVFCWQGLPKTYQAQLLADPGKTAGKHFPFTILPILLSLSAILPVLIPLFLSWKGQGPASIGRTMAIIHFLIMGSPLLAQSTSLRSQSTLNVIILKVMATALLIPIFILSEGLLFFFCVISLSLTGLLLTMQLHPVLSEQHPAAPSISERVHPIFMFLAAFLPITAGIFGYIFGFLNAITIYSLTIMALSLPGILILYRLWHRPKYQ